MDSKEEEEYFVRHIEEAKAIADKAPVEDKDGWAKEIFQKRARHKFYLNKN